MSSIFTSEDLDLLNKTLKMRERLADNIMSVSDDKLPTKASDITAMATLFESIDRTILGRTKLRIEDESAKNDAVSKEMMRALMVELHNSQGKRLVLENTANNGDSTVVDVPVYVPSERPVSAGELILRTDVPELPEEYQ